MMLGTALGPSRSRCSLSNYQPNAIWLGGPVFTYYVGQHLVLIARATQPPHYARGQPPQFLEKNRY